MRNLWSESSTTVKLIIVNAIAFLIVRLSDIAAWGGTLRPGWILEWVAMPMNAGVVYRPWTIISSFFTHYDLVHFFCNAFTLYWFGRLFEEEFRSKGMLLKAYFLGGLAGNVFALAVSMLTGYSERVVMPILLGASGAIVCLLVAVAVATPRRQVWMAFVGNIELRWIAIVTLLIFVVLTIGMQNFGGNLAHIGGAIMGYFTAKYWRKIDQIPLPQIGKRKVRMRATPGYNKDWEYNKRKVEDEKELNRILDKIREKGYNSLTDTEKRTLFDISGNNK